MDRARLSSTELCTGGQPGRAPACHGAQAAAAESGRMSAPSRQENVLVRCSRPGHAAINRTFSFER